MNILIPLPLPKLQWVNQIDELERTMRLGSGDRLRSGLRWCLFTIKSVNVACLVDEIGSFVSSFRQNLEQDLMSSLSLWTVFLGCNGVIIVVLTKIHTRFLTLKIVFVIVISNSRIACLLFTPDRSVWSKFRMNREMTFCKVYFDQINHFWKKMCVFNRLQKQILGISNFIVACYKVLVHAKSR